MSGTRARSFDRVAQLYNDVRPGYPRAVYDFIAAHKSFGPESMILEVGAGQGVATREILDYWGAEITAIEPGENLCRLLRKNTEGRERVHAVKSTFEAFTPETAYDGIFSATAFHWIDPEVKYAKAHRLLKDGGLLALYWNNYSVAAPALRTAIEEVYRKYLPSEDAGRDVVAAQQAGMEKRRAELEDSGWFNLVGHTVIEHTVQFDTARYIGLLKTFSDHSSGDPEVMKSFYDEVGRVILSAGGTIDVRILVNVELGKKGP